MTILIREATASDSDAIADLYVASRADALGYLHRIRTDDEDRAWIKSTVLRRGITWIACLRDRIVGFLALVDDDVDQLYLLPGTYRQGIGTLLLERAKRASPEHLCLYTFQRNTRARAFYEAHGFTPTRLGDGSKNEEQEPDVYYEWHGSHDGLNKGHRRDLPGTVRLLPSGFEIHLAGRLILRHTIESPAFFAGRGEGRMDMHHGNFDISDRLSERAPLEHVAIEGSRITLRRHATDRPALVFDLTETAHGVDLVLVEADPHWNRFWFRLHAEPDEHVWGGGEQMSYFDLRGRNFPIWTSEPGVGRDKSTYITWQSDVTGKAGGDYWTTNYPQPSFLTSRRLAVHLESTAYSVLDFRDPGFHEIEVWAAPSRLEFLAADSFIALVGHVSTRFGRPPELPDWLYNGAVIGLKAGAESFTRLEKYLAAGAAVSALWCEDWAGIRQTSFGRRLFWDWQWNPARYPDLPARIADLRDRGIRFLAYCSPYLCDDGALFPEAEALGLFARNADGETYRVQFGEFRAGVMDFTLPEARTWWIERILRGNMMGIGIAGWMADFGEYLPIDAVLANGDAALMHNAWPTIWAEVNAAAIAGAEEPKLFWMRAGFTGVQGHSTMLWAGDQSVDFSRHDGLQTVICGALSAGLLGNPYHHSDVGGYTSLFGNIRTAELIKRWSEMSAFTAMMRTHEGNRPDDNLQVDQDPEVLTHFARFTRIWRALAPYLRALSTEAAATGLPLQRPLFLHHEDDWATYAILDHYLLGRDLLVAPVHTAGAAEWRVYLPAGAIWHHLWTGTPHVGGSHVTVPAPIGQPPVFYRTGSPFTALFQSLPRI